MSVDEDLGVRYMKFCLAMIFSKSEFLGSSQRHSTREPIGFRMLVLIIPISTTATVLSLWLSSAVACALSTFVWMIFVYWIPVRLKVSMIEWVLFACVVSATVFGLTRLFGWF